MLFCTISFVKFLKKLAESPNWVSEKLYMPSILVSQNRIWDPIARHIFHQDWWTHSIFGKGETSLPTDLPKNNRHVLLMVRKSFTCFFSHPISCFNRVPSFYTPWPAFLPSTLGFFSERTPGEWPSNEDLWSCSCGAQSCSGEGGMNPLFPEIHRWWFRNPKKQPPFWMYKNP